KACVLPENPASYRVVRTKSYLFNKAQLGYKKAAKLLAETLEEEKQTDVKLTDLAVGNINKKAEK
ncbi:DUF892 family protein, partial [Klebsiella pneumoniae]